MFQVKRIMYYYLKGTKYEVYDDLARDGVVITQAALRKVLKDLRGYIPETKHQKHGKYVVVALDNLDIYRRIGLQRTKGGDTLLSELLHFVVSVQCYFDADILEDCECLMMLRSKNLTMLPKAAHSPRWQRTDSCARFGITC